MNALLIAYTWLAILTLTTTVAPRTTHVSGDTPAGKGNVYVSKDHGVSWSRQDTGFPEDDGINALILHNNRVLAGTDRHGIWATDKDGWYSQSKGLPHSSRILSLVGHSQFIFAGLYQNGLYYSADEGNTWQAAGRHPHTNVRALGSYAGILYVGTDNGIYTFNMADLSWRLVRSNLQINDFFAGASFLYAATNKGVLRSRDGITWTSIYDKGAVQKVAVHNNELRLMDYAGHTYRAPETNPYFIAEDLLLPHLNFRLTPASPRIISGDWSEMSFTNSKSRIGLPDSIPLNILLQTPFGMMATKPPLLGGC